MLLKETVQIGSLTLKNRLVMPPMAMGYGTENGGVSEEVLRHYRERAEGGYIGLMETEHCYVNLQGKANRGQISVGADADAEGLRRLAQTMQAGGSKAFAQISHSGSAAKREITGSEALAPSAVHQPLESIGDPGVPRALTKEEIAGIVSDFAAAALRVKEAGFDGAEIHSAHIYLLCQFYSPLTNHRTDEYGGRIEKRLRIHDEVIRAVRAAVGKEYPLSVRLGGCDYMEGGSTIEDSVKAAQCFEAAGADMVSISGGLYGYTIQGHAEPGYFGEMSLAVKKAVKIPVMLTGGFRTAEDAEAFLQKGAADLIGVGRTLLKKPHWAKEVLS